MFLCVSVVLRKALSSHEAFLLQGQLVIVTWRPAVSYEGSSGVGAV